MPTPIHPGTLYLLKCRLHSEASLIVHFHSPSFSETNIAQRTKHTRLSGLFHHAHSIQQTITCPTARAPSSKCKSAAPGNKPPARVESKPEIVRLPKSHFRRARAQGTKYRGSRGSCQSHLSARCGGLYTRADRPTAIARSSPAGAAPT